jgi:hypothetical protein
MGRIHLEYIHDPYFLVCRGCGTHIASVPPSDQNESLYQTKLMSHLVPDKIVNCKLEKGPSSIFQSGPSINIKCINCFEVVGRIDSKNMYSVILSITNPEEH